MKAIRIVTAIVLLSLCISVRADDATAELDGLIVKYLEIVQFVPILRQRLREKAEIENRNAILAAPDKDIVAAVVPVLRPYMKLEEARQLVGFFTSDTAAAITREQLAGNRDFLASLTPEQQEEFNTFTRSPGGDAAQRMAIAWRSPGFWEKVGASLKDLPGKGQE